MKASFNNLVKIFTTGVVVLMFVSLLLFWLRWFCEHNLVVDILPHDAKRVRIEPSGLVPEEIENDPNVTIHSCVNACTRSEGILGIIDYFTKKSQGEQFSTIHFNDWQVVYFDKGSGHIIFKQKIVQEIPDETSTYNYVAVYIGPEGFSETPDKKLGRFISPIVDESDSYPWLTLYDKKLRRFFNIKFDERVVAKGPQLPKDDSHRPVDIGLLRKNPYMVNLSWDGPYTKQPEKDIRKGDYTSYQPKPIIQREAIISQGLFVFVLDETGRIDLLDRETLEFAGIAGYLPVPRTLFPGKPLARPDDLLAYEVLPLVLNTDLQYQGLFAASVNREGTGMALGVFDKDGKMIKRDSSKYKYEHNIRGNYVPVAIPSSHAAYFYVPWGPVMTIAKFLVENLHPPVLSIVSYFTADSIEAASGHNALFVMPNSFIAMKGRDVEGSFISRLSFALLLILPSIVLSIFLAWRVGKDAAVVGLSGNAALFWVLGIVAFGLVGYITYKLVRPKIKLVTCQNCGKPRRPDMESCHHCKGKWHIPELIPPAWRVVD